jgi:hypothetical protein
MLPEELYAMPRWQLHILTQQASRVEARRLHRAATAAMTPHLQNDARRDLLSRLERMSDTPKPIAPPSTAPRVHDPEAAAAWFRERGVRVTEAS